MDYSSFLDAIFKCFVDNFSQIPAIFAEPFLTFFLTGSVYSVNAVAGVPFDIPDVYMLPPILFLTGLGIYLAGKIFLCFSSTRNATMITYGQFEKLAAIVFFSYLSVSTSKEIGYLCLKNKEMLLTAHNGFSFEFIQGFYMYVVGILGSLVFAVIGLYISEAVLALQVKQLAFAYIPFTSFFFEVIRSLLVIASFVVAFFLGRLSFVYSVFLLLVCISFHDTFTKSIRYYSDIYVFSFINEFVGWKRTVNPGKIPTKLKKRIENIKFENPFVTVYPLIMTDRKAYPFKNHERLFVNTSGQKLIFYRQKKTQEEEEFMIDTINKPLYFTENHRCLEFFTLDGSFENINHLFKKPKKDFAFAVSRIYEKNFDEIIKTMGAIDFIKAKEENKRLCSAKSSQINQLNFKEIN